MANVRVVCPTCKAELEIGEEHLGKEVECGSCLQAFVAEDPGAKKGPYKMRRPKDEDADEDEDRPRKKKRRRRRDDEDDYDYSPPDSRERGGGNGLATVSLILGLLSLPLACCCGVFSIPISISAIITGGIAMKNPDGKGMAVTGLILGFIGVALMIGALVVGFGMNAAQFNKFGR